MSDEESFYSVTQWNFVFLMWRGNLCVCPNNFQHKNRNHEICVKDHTFNIFLNEFVLLEVANPIHSSPFKIGLLAVTNKVIIVYLSIRDGILVLTHSIHCILVMWSKVMNPSSQFRSRYLLEHIFFLFYSFIVHL